MMRWAKVVLEPQPIVLAHVGEFLRESRGLLFRSATELMSDLVGRRSDGINLALLKKHNNMPRR
tara:strand:+ start:6975 stop:7166 length:192 start_codon:yes stop_codon:yes gene_type:complete